MIEINKQDFTSKINKIFAENKLSSMLSPATLEQFYLLTVHLLTENEKFNLTAITDVDKIILNHYADCSTMSSRLKKGASIIDVGCGAGFPSLPLAIVRPDLKILAVDSTAKRVNYVAGTAELLGLTNLSTAVMRAEEGGKSPEYREKFDYATARAVAEMRVLCELTLPFVKLGGQLVAMKGKNAEFELTSAKKAIATLGGRDAKVEMITVKGIDESLTHPLIIIDKKERTPASYPRVFAQISKKPL